MRQRILKPASEVSLTPFSEEFAEASFQKYQGFVDQSYPIAINREAQGMLRGNPNTRVGNFVDRESAANYMQWLESEGILEGTGHFVQMNRWLRDPAGSNLYVRPDIRIPSSGVIFDATVGTKYFTDTQIIRFSNYSGGDRITIVRPQEFGSYSFWP